MTIYRRLELPSLADDLEEALRPVDREPARRVGGQHGVKVGRIAELAHFPGRARDRRRREPRPI